MKTKSTSKSKFLLQPLSFGLILLSMTISGFLIVQSIYPYLAERHYRDGYNEEASKRLKYAVEEYELAVKAAPWESQYMMELARGYSDLAAQTTDAATRKDLLLKAEKTALEMIQLDQKNPWYKNRLASIYLLMSESEPLLSHDYLQKAEYYIKQAAEDDHENPIFKLNYAYFLHRLGRLDEAENYYRITISQDTGVSEAHFNLADLQKRRGDIIGALNSYQNIVKKNPNFSGINVAIWQTAIALYNQTNDRQYLTIAANYLQKEVNANTTDLNNAVTLGSIYAQIGNWELAYRAYESILNYYPSQDKLIPLYIQAAKNAGKIDELKSKASQRLLFNPSDPLFSTVQKQL